MFYAFITGGGRTDVVFYIPVSSSPCGLDVSHLCIILYIPVSSRPILQEYFCITKVTNKHCILFPACHPSCLTCSGSSQSECTSCFGAAELNSGRCIVECPDGFYQTDILECQGKLLDLSYNILIIVILNMLLSRDVVT